MAQAADFAHVVHGVIEEFDKDYGRLEVRRYWIGEDLRTLPDTTHWAGLRSIGRVERTCTVGDTHTREHRSATTSSTLFPPRHPASRRG